MGAAVRHSHDILAPGFANGLWRYRSIKPFACAAGVSSRLTERRWKGGIALSTHVSVIIE